MTDPIRQTSSPRRTATPLQTPPRRSNSILIWSRCVFLLAECAESQPIVLILPQAYYRRAVALTAILKSKEALRDFKTVVRKAPNDKDAKLKLAECEKIVKRVAFLAAIDPGEEPSAAEGLDLEAMVVEADYDGARLETEMTPEFITDMLERFKNGKRIHKKYVYQIILAVKKILYDEPTMVEIEIEDGASLTVCGDTHGQYNLKSPK